MSYETAVYVCSNVALVIFAGAFAVVLRHALGRRHGEAFDRAAHIASRPDDRIGD